MKKIYSLIAVMACLAMTFSCSESVEPQNPERGVLSISLSSTNLATRAEMAGVDALNENAINTVHYFLYASGKTAQPALKWGKIASIDGNLESTVRVNVTEDELNTVLFPKPYTNECEVFLIVNLPESETIDKNKTSVADLEALALEADFGTKRTQDAFVMTGLGTARIVDRKKILAATGTINVDRVASKLTIHLDVNHSIEDKGATWVSDPDNMKVTFCNAQGKALLSGVAGAAEAALFNYADGTKLTKTDEDADKNTKWDCTQFYSYPQTWTTGSPEQPYYLITLPWKNETEGSTGFRNCYYKVYVNTASLERNTWYDVNLTLDVLGSFYETEPKVLLDLTYQVCNWSEFTFSADIQGARFLVVDQNEYVMNNVNTLQIPFLTSHECELVNVTVTKRNIKDNTGDTTVSPSDYTCQINSTPGADGQIESYIEYSKVLDNIYTSSTFDFVPYTVTLTIRHKDDTNFTETITITQYPAIYGLDYANSDFGNGKGYNDDHNTMVNGYYGENRTSSSASGQINLKDQDFFASSSGYYSTDYSENMYVFTVSSVQNTDYIIGDPRTITIDSDLVNATRQYYNKSTTATAWVQAPALYDGGSSRGLKYYYPTDTIGTRNMIAPKFRIASSYGVLFTSASAAKELEGMRKRCASYQEDGYPAGRWRLPTEAEFKFIISQVNKGTLPQLYVEGEGYWCAHGFGIPDENGNVTMYHKKTSTTGYSTRCVYDEWYWGSEQLSDRSKFTWGDMPR